MTITPELNLQPLTGEQPFQIGAATHVRAVEYGLHKILLSTDELKAQAGESDWKLIGFVDPKPGMPINFTADLPPDWLAAFAKVLTAKLGGR